ncbi:outer membrane receptor protein involved in Fe transport [Methylovirgula ligni]|uniref:Outer membrane receptor protein involved in Fe transport n=1 Tax=Methylovirgula ligni TaxID=569860 RepID=A0A3D9YTW7_9HYPH|nr:TonB-dependent receptor [Methylovirgula ligni]REF85924.1 outer membrane receptor protein involved in Fe transport [Methylovirgula ligni]
MRLSSLFRVAAGAAALIAANGVKAQQALPQVNVTAAGENQSPLAPSHEVLVETQALDAARANIFAPVGANAYEIDETTINNLPQGQDTPLEKVLLQAPGVSQDSAASGDLHVRNEHANVQYRINDILLPDGVSGFGLMLETRFISSLTLLDGALPAQYGLHTAGVVDIQTRSGTYQPGGSLSVYGGSHATLTPSFDDGGTIGNTQFYVAGQLLTDNVGIENPTPDYDAIHDLTAQGKFFGYVSTLLGDGGRFSIISGTSVSSYEIPNSPGQAPVNTVNGISDFNSSLLNENQVERNFYNVAAWQKSAGPIDAQIAFFSRYSTLHFVPDSLGDIIFNGVASDVQRNSLLNGFQGDAGYHLGPHTIRFGFEVSGESTDSINNDLVLPLDTGGNPESTLVGKYDASSKLGWLGSIYAQDEWRITDQLTLNAGLRFDQMAAYVTTNQLSPRVSLTYKPFAGTTFHAGYARYFTPPEQALAAPTNLALYANTSAAPGVNESSPVRPERSDYFDAGVDQKLLPGLSAGVDAYYKRATNLLDDGQFGQALVLTAFNYAKAYNTGVELKADYQMGDLSAYANFAWARQRATQVSSNQYLFDPDELAYISDHYIYTDHAQTLTGSAGISYLWQATKFSADLIYGSGLRNGFANTGTVAPYTQVNLGISHEFRLPGNSGLGPLELRFDVVNLLDNIYEIRDGSGIGVFAPQYGPRRGFFGALTQKF